MKPDLFNWEALLIGIQFLLGLQLLIVACIHFFNKPKSLRISLAFLCLILGLWFFKRVFNGYWQNSFFLFLLIGPGKPIFVGSLLLFYYKSFTSNLSQSFILKHLLAPTTYYVLLIVFRFFLVSNSSETNHVLSLFFTSGVFLIFWYYFFVTRKELRLHVKKKLIPRAYKKVMFLFYSLYFFLLQVPIWDMFKNIIQAKVLSQQPHEIAVYLYDTVFKYLGEYSSYTYLHLLGYLLFLYALSEIVFFKKLFLPKDTLIHEKTLRNKANIDKMIQEYFMEKKLYKKPELSIDSCAKIFSISKKELTDYFKITNKGVFKDYINKLRVNEYKMLLEKEDFIQYDLIGLAKECGFKSKSTFFRVFKEFEGVTPNAYKKQVLKESLPKEHT